MPGLSLAKSLELSLVRPQLTRADVESGCELAAAGHLAAVLVYPVHVADAVRVLAGSDTQVIAAVGFPFGQELVETRLRSAELARADGADELALMLDTSLLASGRIDAARAELERILASAFWSSLVTTRGTGQVTVVLETHLADPEALRPLLDDLHESPATFLQTSTGLHAWSVSEQHLRQLRAVTPPDVQLKAVGGIGTYADAEAVLNAGAVRAGSAAAVSIAHEERQLREVRRRA